MNLSEIRKKAQQEKTGGADAAFASESAPVEVAEPVEKPVAAPAPDFFEDLVPEELESAQLTIPDEFSQGFDPLAVLMAGRAAAINDDDVQTAAAALAGQSGAEFQEFLCFRVAAEKYAVNILDIKEIIRSREVTEVPRVPPFVSGVLSLRGIIIPVFNMRMRLGHSGATESGKERIIVVKKGEDFCGVQVDEVIQVVKIAAGTIEPPPAVLDGIDRDFVGGIGRFGGQMLILLNLGKVLDLNLY
jgi:purine-binding chemotaxis protein CheW